MSTNSSSPSTPPPTILDDSSPLLLFSGPWTHYVGSEGAYDASQWSGGTFASCGGGDNRTACEVRAGFEGTSAAFHGDNVKDHGGFACRLETSTSPGVVIPEGLWAWYFGGAQSNRRVYGLNKTLCSVESIPSGRHTLVLEVEPDQVARGIAIDYMSYSNSTPAGTSYRWSSYFNSAVPPTALRNTTATPTLPYSTTSSPSSSQTSPSSSSSGFSTLAVELGAGLGGVFLLASLAIGVWLFLKKRRNSSRRRLRLSSSGGTFSGYDEDDLGGGGVDSPQSLRSSSVWRPAEGVGVGEAMAMQGQGYSSPPRGGGAKEREKGGEALLLRDEARARAEADELGSFRYDGRSRYSSVPSHAPYAFNDSTSPHLDYSPTATVSPPYPPTSSYSPYSSPSFAVSPPAPANLPPAHPHPPTPLPAPRTSPTAAIPPARLSASSRDYAYDLPDDATLADPEEFSERR